MSLTDIMSGANLSAYAEVALLLFAAVFVAIVLRTFAPGRRRELEQTARLPFDDGRVVSHTTVER